MADVQLSIEVANGVAVPAMVRRTVEATYSREVTEANSTTGEPATTIVQDVVQVPLGGDATASLALASVAPNTSVHVRFLSGTGATRLERSIAVPEGTTEVSLELGESDVKALAEPELTAELPNGMVRRVGQLVATNTTPVTFRPNDFRIAIIDPARWTSLGLDAVFTMAALQTTSAPVNPETLPQIAGLAWLPIHLGIGGGFDVLLPAESGKAWLWWFSDLSNVALGAVSDDLGTRQPDTMTLPLPPFAAAPEGGPAEGIPGRVPVDITESELSDNPDVFTEDPGAFCRPFSNPERILGERAFHVILRAEQPTLSSEPTRKFPTFPLFDFDPPIVAEQPGTPIDRGGGGLRSDRRSDSRRHRTTDAPGVGSPRRSRQPGDDDGSPDAPGRLSRPARSGQPWPRRDQRRQPPRLGGRRQSLPGRHGRSRPHPRVPPALAIQRLLARDRRQDADPRAAPDAADPEDRVGASRTDPSRGADPAARPGRRRGGARADLRGHGRGEPGGVGERRVEVVDERRRRRLRVRRRRLRHRRRWRHSRASSSSSTSGGRETRAAEEQRLRDTIRRFADSLRKLDSIVVTEVSQEETVTGTTEIVRNANYAHSLTVIYYQILRHLKLETAFASVRECVFVPFAIKPFTFARAYRWRESIRQGLRDRKYSTALNYLRDVTTGFAGSTVPPGRRADHQIRFIRGSITVSLGVERPATAFEAVFDEPSWSVLRPFLGVPALAIHARLREVVALAPRSDLPAGAGTADRGQLGRHAQTLGVRCVAQRRLHAGFALSVQRFSACRLHRRRAARPVRLPADAVGDPGRRDQPADARLGRQRDLDQLHV